MIPWRRAARGPRCGSTSGFIRYGPPSPPRPLRDIAPASLYVLAQGPGSDDDAFSYAQDGPRRQGEVAAYLGRAAAMEGASAGSWPPATLRPRSSAATRPRPRTRSSWSRRRGSPGSSPAAVCSAWRWPPNPPSTSGPSPACCTTIPACASPASRSSPVPRAVASGARPEPVPGVPRDAGRPRGRAYVRLAFDQFDQFQAGLKRPASTLRGSLRVAADGRVLALDADLRFDAGGRANLCAYVASMAALSVGGAYRVPYAVARGSACSREVQAGSQRGFGGAEAALVVLDEAATRDGHDPIEVRRLGLLGAATARSRARRSRRPPPGRAPGSRRRPSPLAGQGSCFRFRPERPGGATRSASRWRCRPTAPRATRCWPRWRSIRQAPSPCAPTPSTWATGRPPRSGWRWPRRSGRTPPRWRWATRPCGPRSTSRPPRRPAGPTRATSARTPRHPRPA